uniref:(northern house mosquito) hypothetical protein n=1 Tax=Culex pipiens TaxID=7175 RepID=A0A8D8IPH3_CULPI
MSGPTLHLQSRIVSEGMDTFRSSSCSANGQESSLGSSELLLHRWMHHSSAWSLHSGHTTNGFQWPRMATPPHTNRNFTTARPFRITPKVVSLRRTAQLRLGEPKCSDDRAALASTESNFFTVLSPVS